MPFAIEKFGEPRRGDQAGNFLTANGLLSLAAIVTVVAIPIDGGGTRLGDLNRESKVFIPDDDINAPSVTTKDGFPVFEIRVPEGYFEVQVRASLTNFEPGFWHQPMHQT